MTYCEAIQFLYRLRWFGAKFGLDNTRKLAALAGNPQDQLRFIHVAGTNGKGSTCAMLEGIYRAAGLRVGLFTSPHLVAFSERIQVNRDLISEEEVARLADGMRKLLDQGWNSAADAQDPFAREHPTFFEVVTVMAMLHFVAKKCDLVIWETGLGGRLDATNIVTPIASIITNIQFDHQQYLGETLAGIATEKAGIIKPGVPVITGTNTPEALEVIRNTAQARSAPLTVVTPAEKERPPLSEIRLPLLGEHQRTNAAVALAAVRTLTAQLPVANEAVRRGLHELHWPGRLQLITRPGGQKILLDGAHNVGGAQMMRAAFQQYFPAETPVLVLGILRDKDWPVMCQTLAPLASRILLVPVHSERTAEPHGLAEVCRQANPLAPVIEYDSLAAALSDTARDSFVTIAGSLYLIGEAMELLHLSAASPGHERGLNEWSARP